MERFLDGWAGAATTSFGLFWMAFWAFGLGYLISSMIQVFVTRERMQGAMGESEAKGVALGTFFGFISSSCSFAALATSRALFAKGAAFIPAMAFLLASTNLVIELGIVIAVFLSWQFVVGEYIGGIILILLMWLAVRLTRPKQLIENARQRAMDALGESEDNERTMNWRQLIRSIDGWQRVAMRYFMEWQMVWKDVTVGFTVAGIIAAFVPRAFFETLFIGSGQMDPGFLSILAQAVVGPVAAFFTFIGSMGNIPLAAVLFSNGVSFAGVMAFIFSDLVVLPVLRIHASYYGWRMALYILGVFLVVLVATAILMHYAFAAVDMLPDPSIARSVTEREFFAVDYTLFLNLAFGLLTLAFFGWRIARNGIGLDYGSSTSEKVLFYMAAIAWMWLIGGAVLALLL